MTCSDSGLVRRLLVPVMAVVIVGMDVGCGRPPLLVPVRGVVLLDGKPLTCGVVQFQPAAGQVASGLIADDGTFLLSRHLPNDGIPPGTYRVAVTAFDPKAEVQSVENLIVPVKYTRFGSSGIEFTIFPGTLEPLVVSLSSDSEAAGVSASESSLPRGDDDRETSGPHLGGA